MVEWLNAEVKEVKHWTNELFSLRVQAPIDIFTAGQFTKLALEIDGKYIQRAYSYVNAPKDPLLEFYLVKVPTGKLSPHLQSLNSGSRVLINKEASGFFILSIIPDCEILWMLATGTAIGPYLSILQQGEDLERFRKIILIHAVRYSANLSFLPLMKQLSQQYAGKLHIQSVVSREKTTDSLHGRIPYLIKSGELESVMGLPMTSATSHVMICGNPEMVRDTQKLLEDTRDMYKHFKHKSGHVTSEYYW